MRLTVISNQTSRDPGFAKKCFNRAYIIRLAKLNRKSKAVKWYTSSNFQKAKKLLDNRCPQLEYGIDYEAMGVEYYRGLLRPRNYCPSRDDHNNANQIRHISRSVPPANHEIPRADHGISVPPPSPYKSEMLPLPIQSTMGKAKELYESNVERLLMDLAEDGSDVMRENQLQDTLH
jgi:hypothetical protein